MLPFIIAGLVSGAVYGLAGVGLVLTYKTSGVFNFAYGALATIAAYAFYFMHVQRGLPWVLAAVVCLLVIAPVVGLLFAGLARVLTDATLAVQVASTVGVVLIVQAGFTIIYGTTKTITVPAFLPANVVTIFGTRVTVEDIIVFAVAVVATVALYVLFRWSRLGMAMRAVVENAGLLDLAGTSPGRVRRWAWIIGVAFATVSGLLLAPFVPLSGTTLTFLVVQAFGAAAIGAFTSLPVTFAGGLAIGVLGSLATEYLTSGILAQIPASFPFIVLFLVLLLFPKRWMRSRTPVVIRREAWVTPLPVQLFCGAAVLVVLVLVPQWVGFQLENWTIALTTVMLFLSLGLLVRTSGQVSLCQVTFTAIGAAGFSHLAVDHHWPWAAALLVAGLIAVPIGALLAIPAARLGGLYLALATLGFGIAVSQMFYTSSWMFGELGLGLSVPRPHLSWLSLDSDTGFYYLCLVLTALIALLVIVVNRSRLGRLLRGMADSPLALTTNGASVNVTRVLVFCLSAFIAAVSGALAGMANGTVTGDNYQPLVSLTYLALIVITTGSAPWYALIAGFAVTLVPSYLTSANTANYLQILFGALAILIAVAPESSRGTPARLRSALDGVFRTGRFAWPRRAVAASVPVESAEATQRADAPAQLTAEGLRVQFGGLVAVDGVTVDAAAGRVTGLIGPNGAGKTTMFNALSGLNRPSRGRVLVDGHDVTRKGPALRARRGLGRTFQQTELFDSLTVRANVALGAEAGLAGANPLRHLLPRRSDSRRVNAATARALDLCGLTTVADAPVDGLPTGQRRLAELARCLAGGYRILLLDEPSSGLDRTETARFAEILTRSVREQGIGILLVEHDMTLVNSVCDYIYVLNFGQLIYHGAPPEVMASDVVRAAYLGDGAGLEGTGDLPETREEAQR